ncbi:cation diffusion facilitator family transporter [Hyphomicrobium sp.]|uniref:cation diffusion facilitator family transporter n=1 Tax=Hyphomicrobium sp. TaxID=82 RepID=UPI002D78A0DC|nr:cation diffusion facilitator family transporter [Hyphomicrobium sp.]HET6388429.1 cation diffusion facilitator family transporter [Hyphomicrobium sp.]
MSETALSKKVVFTALAGNIFVAVIKFVAAAVTGSSAMVSEAMHSLVDTGNEGLLLYGYVRASRHPDRTHPLGYGREIYFWSFIVAVLLFTLGAGASIYEGVTAILNPHPITNVSVNYIVLALSALFEGSSWMVGVRRFGKYKGRRSYWQAVRESKDPPAYMVVFEDSAALIGIAIAALGNFLSVHLNMPLLDGVASILIGIVLATIAILLAHKTKELLIGEPASDEITSSIMALARSEPSVDGANNIFAIHLSRDQILVALSLEFADELRTPQIEAAVVRLEKRIREKHPQVIALFIKPQTRRSFEQMLAQRRNGSADTA